MSNRRVRKIGLIQAFFWSLLNWSTAVVLTLEVDVGIPHWMSAVAAAVAVAAAGTDVGAAAVLRQLCERTREQLPLWTSSCCRCGRRWLGFCPGHPSPPSSLPPSMTMRGDRVGRSGRIAFASTTTIGDDDDDCPAGETWS